MDSFWIRVKELSMTKGQRGIDMLVKNFATLRWRTGSLILVLVASSGRIAKNLMQSFKSFGSTSCKIRSSSLVRNRGKPILTCDTMTVVCAYQFYSFDDFFERRFLC